MSVVWFLFAHPDDEFAVTGLIKDRCVAGETAQCVYLTDGTFGGQSAAVRRNETLRVLARLGMPADRVHFIGEAFGFTDGDLCNRLEDALAALLNLPAAPASPDLVYCPAWEGGHQDHDATHLLALAVAARVGCGLGLRQFPLYNGDGLVGPMFRVLNPLAANGPIEVRASGWVDRLEQLRVSWSYPSQWRTWAGLFPFLAWHVLTDGGFRTQPVDPGRVLEPPHPGPPLYERRGFMSSAEFRSRCRNFIDSRILFRP